VIEALLAAGGKVIDSSPMYGRAEETTGELLAGSGRRGEAFLATKVWVQGRQQGVRQMEESMRLLRASRIDLMQVHNLVDWKTHLATLRGWKEQGACRYLGITHYTVVGLSGGGEGAARREARFLQINYALDDRAAEQRLLPLAAERGVAVIVNMPFGGGGCCAACSASPCPTGPPRSAARAGPGAAQVRARPPGGDLRHPGTRRREHMDGQRPRRLRRGAAARFWNDKAEAIVR
jgi:diketogulonate reductase-like aldo/keto reductase